jgi:hypothetical protein
MTSFLYKNLRCVWLSIVVISATITAAEQQADVYAATAEQRALKISNSLALTDPAHSARVGALIARQYIDLNALQAARERDIKSINSNLDKAPVGSALVDHNAAFEAKVASLHRAYLARLAMELTPEQIDLVKDGHTYGVLPLTYRVYQKMLPQLTPGQKDKILGFLTEARELAMDAGSAKEKHAWFGKYKGKINNYLSAEGFNMKEAEKNLLTPR